MTFENAMEFVFKEEGIHSNDPADPGGDTWFGISRIANPDMPWPPTKEQAMARYRAQYWDACRCDNFPWEVALLVFDTAVQHGTGFAMRALQMALNIPADGIVGKRTIEASWAAAPQQLEDVLVFRAIHYTAQKAFPRFGRGWIRRLFHLHTEILKGLS